MIDKKPIWQEALGGVAEDFFDLFLSPVRPFPEDVTYPEAPGMEVLIKDRFDGLVLPEKRLLHMVELIDENWAEQYEERVADWVALFEWEILRGCGDSAAFASDGASFEGLRRLARIWGMHLAQVMGRVMRTWEMYPLFGELMLVVAQLPDKELGEGFRLSLTPSYRKAHASVKYITALFSQNQRELQDAEQVLQASDADLAGDLEQAMYRVSSIELGRYLKQLLIEFATLWEELVSSEDFRQNLPDKLPFAFQWLAWYLGYCFRQRLQNDPPRAKRVLEAIGKHSEVDAVMEQYKFVHGWGGDRDRAIVLAWEPIGREIFRMNGQIPTVSGDEEQEWEEDQQLKLIGIADGLETYCRRNPAYVGLMDGVSGGVRSYLAKAAENKELSYYRKQNKDLLAEAKHASDFRTPDDEKAEELSDDEILSRLRERYHPSADPVVQEVEAKESAVAWYASLTEKEKTAVSLAAELDTEEEIAAEMGISQQRVSQLLKQTWRKYRKLCQ